MAAKIIAQMVVAGATVLFRAASQAWGQALVNAQKTGVAQEAASKAANAAAGAASSVSGMTSQEARLILGLENNASWSEVIKRYKHLFSINEQSGSFYLTSKIYRAKEQLDQEYTAAGLKTDEPEDVSSTKTSEDPSKDAK
mmetsp:Transcript_21046/g.37570  ORF Transcript_21046/g.37570 Transcript_21046/m.37570 type:complete len:141 (-) Transcript_21046:156-578(-)|eukprot:CAMPEP_0175062820 /NCGR_PEP_ID=MMETSP0052_2-20121109/14388_1 /TAXON_ID=51329 ORGANISM="Polytomella parva, Strain SAG 63-3" /NCGR_SAMPLE_ID=MMETSP0052_2 /ASSEMBLY_ACC=CAM_ASM_000194 /LENGTH=140 /DNA_ID=CAMNT_0016328899 /DNA_START=46 /DNA_END=468 /DNA_ORIENTATION=-